MLCLKALPRTVRQTRCGDIGVDGRVVFMVPSSVVYQGAEFVKDTEEVFQGPIESPGSQKGWY